MKPWEKYQNNQTVAAAEAPKTETEMPWLKYKDVATEAIKEPNALVKGGMTALDGLMRGLDYAGGVARTGVGEFIDAFVPGNNVTGDDWKKALVGKAPTSSQYLEKLGVGEMGSLSDIAPGLYSDTGKGMALQRGGSLDITGRGTVGTALDIASDPLTYVTLGAAPLVKNAPKLLKDVISPLKTAGQYAGKKIYKSAFKEADEVAKQFNKIPISDIGWKYNIVGSQDKINKQLAGLTTNLANKSSQIIDDASAAGANVDIYGMLNRAKDSLKTTDSLDVLKNDGLKKSKNLVTRMTNAITDDEILNGISARRASDIKTSFYDNLPKNAYNNLSDTKAGNDFIKGLGRDFKEATEQSVDKISSGLGADLKATNQELGSLLSARKSLNNAAVKEGKPNALTEVDALAFMYSPEVFTMKQLAKFSKGARAKTAAGKILGGDKSSNAWDILSRQGLREADE